MDRMVIEALKHKYEAEKADAREAFKTSDIMEDIEDALHHWSCLLYTSPSPRDRQKSRMPSSA